MNVSTHNPDRYISDLRTLISQGKKRIGFLVGAGAAVGVNGPSGAPPLIPAIEGLTAQVLGGLEGANKQAVDAILKTLAEKNIEALLSKIRALSSVLDENEAFGLTGEGHKLLSQEICEKIGKIVNVNLPEGDHPFGNLVNWIVGTDRDHPVEIFTTNYDLLFEEAFESRKAPYFDGFTGSQHPFFDPVTISRNDLPARWTKLWKLHGSLGWKPNDAGEVIRTSDKDHSHLIFPEHIKYDQTQKAPYSALFDRLRNFLTTKDTLLIAVGFSFADAHVTACIDESLAENASASLFAFQYRQLQEEPAAVKTALKRPNFSVYARDGAVINGVKGDWKPGDAPSKDWEAIRSTYWAAGQNGSTEFLLGDFAALAEFFAHSRSDRVTKSIEKEIAATDESLNEPASA